MKKIGCFLILIFGVIAVYAQNTQNTQTFNNAIDNAAGEISGKLPEGSTVVVISFQSESERLTNYVIDELNGKIANIGKLRSVERRQLDTIRAELNLNMSGEVSDASAQRIGRMLGSQYIIMGSIDTVGSQYRVRFRAITTETASIAYSFSQNVRNDAVLESLLRNTGTIADFSSQERLRASALNLFFGAGSFTVQKDYLGGGITAGAEGVGAILIVYSLAKFNTVKGDYAPQYNTLIKSYEAYPFFIGLGLYLGGAVFGVVRAQTYRKPGSIAAISPFDGLQLDLVSPDNKNTGVQISYKWEF